VNAKHTPGPWVVIPRGESSGKSVATIEPKPESMETTNYWTVADVNGLRAEWEANLRLIAAAPELLEALQGVVAFWDSITMEDSVNDLHIKARAAIVKATGS
jgi:hypothetical protein